eukprot:symbB.v1.2.039967.t1/scaffold6905.1/size14687/1
MSADGLWFDQDGMVTDAAVAALVEEDGQSLILRGERYALQACPSLPSNSNFRSSLFFPPGWPTTMPTGFDEWVAYDLMTAVVESPMMLLELFIYWKYLAGVGDSTKSPDWYLVSLVVCHDLPSTTTTGGLFWATSWASLPVELSSLR